MDYLYDALENKKEINLYSSVYLEIKKDNPSITIWINDNELNITSTKEYNARAYYEKNAIKLFEVTDSSKIKEIYDNVCVYIYPYEQIINKLISMFESTKKLELK